MIPIYVIYDHPKDFPHCWVMRRHMVVARGSYPDPNPIAFGPDLETIRSLLPEGLRLVQRPGEDPDPVIFEVWA